jgi:hypothetical protein
LRTDTDWHFLKVNAEQDWILVTDNAIEFRGRYLEIKLYPGVVFVLPAVWRTEQLLLLEAALDWIGTEGDMVNRAVDVAFDLSRVPSWQHITFPEVLKRAQCRPQPYHAYLVDLTHKVTIRTGSGLREKNCPGLRYWTTIQCSAGKLEGVNVARDFILKPSSSFALFLDHLMGVKLNCGGFGADSGCVASQWALRLSIRDFSFNFS